MNGVNWSALERLRAIFLENAPVRGSYWSSEADLASYDATLGERIGWKWDAVLGELTRLGWRPPAGPVLDFGCGSGVAARRLLSTFGPSLAAELRVHDKSPLAESFAMRRAQESFPGLHVRRVAATELEDQLRGATLVLSHVLSELPTAGRARLLELAGAADCILWVEPGSHADSHALIAMREGLRERFDIIAPCTHTAACGLLTPGNERHWCHFFGTPPWEIFADPEWAEFADRMGVDLRSLPFSYLVLERRGLRERPGCAVAGCQRVLGTPRFYKGYAKLFSCSAEGVEELTWAKRNAGPLFKTLKAGEAGSLFRASRSGDQLEQMQPVPPLPEPETEPDSGPTEPLDPSA